MDKYNITLTHDELLLIKYALCAYEADIAKLMEQEKKDIEKCSVPSAIPVLQSWAENHKETLLKLLTLENKLYAL